MRPLALGMLATVALVARSSGADAAGTEIALVIDYKADAGCGDAASFVERVKRRAPEVRTATTEETAERVRVALEREASAFRGTLAFPDVDGSSPRTFRGARCDDVANAVAVALALHAVEAARAEPSTETASTRPVSAEPIQASRADTPADPVPTPARTPDVEHVEHAALAGATPRSAVAPEIAPGLDLTYALGLPRNDVASFRFGLGYAAGTSERLLFRLVTGHTEACFFRLGSAEGAWWLSPCVRGEVGRLLAEGRAKHDVKGGLPWLALGTTILGRVRVAGPIVVEAEAGFVVPLTRHAYYAASEFDRTLEYTTPAIAFFGRLAAGFRFR